MFRFLHFCTYKQPALGMFIGAGFASVYLVWGIACGKRVFKGYEEDSTIVPLGK